MRPPVRSAVYVTFAFASLLATRPATAAPSPVDLPIDDILQRNIAAQGGDAKIATLLDGLRLTGNLTFGGGDFSVKAQYGVLTSRGRLRLEVTLQGLTQLTSYDGKTAWKIDPFQGRRRRRAAVGR